MQRGILFDLDGTLVESFTRKPLPGVANILQELQSRDGLHIGVATNQAGPLWEAITGQAKYPTIHKLAQNLLSIAQQLQLTHTLWLISLWDPRIMTIGNTLEEVNEGALAIQQELQQALQGSLAHAVSFIEPEYRKPRPGMLLRAAAEWKIAPANLQYAGDMDTDEEAALNAGARFVHASALTTLLT
ncbi:hypothetical protein EPA93_12850 [Ktedonosporobacter rubrisoli]|uniref:HAD family hydrolase n=1 Tax=Ktedonosporobacter rubrisoli TaxID=2509675 RepID=A0A4P6JNM5_KTERU|nr:HAD hydrolase-like protein [Ktedonosporobacter rubrisoli]QBD76845.1 hypothetical protein EPA93_12850 [Ktedonosporobacter rubrisoli]